MYLLITNVLNSINNNIEFQPSEIIFLISILYIDYNIKNIKIQLQYTIKHIIQSLDNETWNKELVF